MIEVRKIQQTFITWPLFIIFRICLKNINKNLIKEYKNLIKEYKNLIKEYKNLIKEVIVMSEC